MFSNTDNYMRISRADLQMGVEFYLEKLVTKEKERLYITSNDEVEVESVIITIDEYELLQTLAKKYEICKSLQDASTTDVLLEIRKDIKDLKQDV